MSVTWIPTTEKRYYDMLGILPPAAYGNGGAFQVGEAYDHNSDGKPTFRAFKMDGEKYLEADRPLSFREFAAEVGKATYCYHE